MKKIVVYTIFCCLGFFNLFYMVQAYIRWIYFNNNSAFDKAARLVERQYNWLNKRGLIDYGIYHMASINRKRGK